MNVMSQPQSYATENIKVLPILSRRRHPRGLHPAIPQGVVKPLQ